MLNHFVFSRQLRISSANYVLYTLEIIEVIKTQKIECRFCLN